MWGYLTNGILITLMQIEALNMLHILAHFLYIGYMPWKEHIPGLSHCPFGLSPKYVWCRHERSPPTAWRASAKLQLSYRIHEYRNKCLVSYWILEWFVMKHYCGNKIDTDAFWYHLRTSEKYRCLGPMCRDPVLARASGFLKIPQVILLCRQGRKIATLSLSNLLSFYILHAQFWFSDDLF